MVTPSVPPQRLPVNLVRAGRQQPQREHCVPGCGWWGCLHNAPPCRTPSVHPPLSSFQSSAGILLRSLMWSACWPSRMTGPRSSSSMLRIGRSPAGSARISTRGWPPQKADVRSVLAEGFAQQPRERIPGQMPLRVLMPEQQVIHRRQFFESVRGQLTGLLIARQNSLRR